MLKARMNKLKVQRRGYFLENNDIYCLKVSKIILVAHQNSNHK
jgi:hypothetical protein